jgi:CRP-like cAMP-binding protein
MSNPSRATSNRLLSRLSTADSALLEPYLKRVALPLRKQIEAPGRPIKYNYFIESGFASVVTNGNHRNRIEVGIVGREGMTGLAVVLASDRSPHETFMQNAGEGSRIPTADLRRAVQQSDTLRDSLLRYVHSFMVQAAYTAASYGRSKLEERLARWLLMAHDRLDTSELTITHEFLSIMLSARRPSITEALNLLEKRGHIEIHRGSIAIVDRNSLIRATNGAYGAPEAEFNRLFG